MFSTDLHTTEAGTYILPPSVVHPCPSSPSLRLPNDDVMLTAAQLGMLAGCIVLFVPMGLVGIDDSNGSLAPHSCSGNDGITAATTVDTSLTPAQTLISNPAAADSADDKKQNFNHVINSIQKILSLHQLYLTVSSFNVAA